MDKVDHLAMRHPIINITPKARAGKKVVTALKAATTLQLKN